MKKYTCLLLFALLLNGCDDGDLTIETFNFDDATAVSCTGTENYKLIYKLKNQESLLLQIPDDVLKNEITENGIPEEFNIDNSLFKLVYRAYDGTVTSANICDAIRPVSPNVNNEWFATGGTILISTNANYTSNTTDNSTRISGYTHNIQLKNVTYSKPSGEQIGPSFTFGDFTTALEDTETLSLVFDESALQCSESKQVYNTNGSESFTIDNPDPALIANTPTPAGAPIIQNITPTTNKVTFKVYSNGTITNNYFCVTPTPTTPTVRETWIAESGTIQVETSTLAGSFKHIITFKNVKLVKGNVSFLLGNNFKSWELITSP
ncbi:hypothetical protein [Flavobacterium piscis]|uniref:Lipoprotein n=1 Tax=Flavobacterium piscis TaxID=1114874 RepID=A0ABU1YB56_9FLAO|nr:hypothetical protein [Flavobacterium piscis]MDR7210865.1 hypothetical protein [Flavobacterium piscis]